VRWSLGSSHLPNAALADLWQRIATSMRNSPAVLGYDIMNEPSRLAHSPRAGAAIWERASQGAVTAIRATGDSHVIAVEAYGASGPEQFAQLDPTAWIHDPLQLTRYEMHQYFDSDGTGRYQRPLASAAATATRVARAAGTLARIPHTLACLPD
jgi:endoglucanase